MVTIQDVCRWKQADSAKTLERLRLDKLFASYGIGAAAEDLFGQVPTTYVHTGDVTHRGPLLCDAQGHGIFVIEGSLTVDGGFTFYTADAYTILVITGDLTAAHLCQAWDTQLVVLGDTKIAGLLYIDVSDAGFALFRGAVTSQDRLIRENGVEADVPMFAKQPSGTAQAPELWDGPSEPDEIHAALARGDRLFVPPATGAKQPPSAASLAKMTVFDVLTTVTSGFEDMQIQDDTINPNWFRKGKPGCPLVSLSLIAETYLDAFPDTLATLKSLTLLNHSDAARLQTMLRSLPTLRSLVKLRISGSALDRIPPEIGALEQLEELELNNNESLATLPLEIANLPRLRRLMVVDNAIQTLPPGLDLDRIPNVIFDEKALSLRRGS